MTSPITIVVPVYNREYLLQRTLDSIACQSVAPARIVLFVKLCLDGLKRLRRVKSRYALRQRKGLLRLGTVGFVKSTVIS